MGKNEDDHVISIETHSIKEIEWLLQELNRMGVRWRDGESIVNDNPNSTYNMTLRNINREGVLYIAYSPIRNSIVWGYTLNGITQFHRPYDIINYSNNLIRLGIKHIIKQIKNKSI